MTSCSPFDSVVIVVVLPMSKSAFLAFERRYIASIASTAGVTIGSIKILSVVEISTRSSKSTTFGRSLLALSVQVKTSVLLAAGQHANIEVQSVLNDNLIKNGLPSGTLEILQSAYSDFAGVSGVPVSTPEPAKSGSSTESTHIQLGTLVGVIVGGTVGVTVVSCLVYRKWRRGGFHRKASLKHYAVRD